MRTSLTLLSISLLLMAGCRSMPRRAARAAATPAAAPVAAAKAPSAEGPQRLRYYDMKDFELRNGILIARGTPSQLRAIEDHISAMRSILREAKAGAAALASAPAKGPVDTRTVQIHAIADLVALWGDGVRQTLRDTIRRELGEATWAATVLRFQGESALVVKAAPDTQDRIARILEGMRTGAR